MLYLPLRKLIYVKKTRLIKNQVGALTGDKYPTLYPSPTITATTFPKNIWTSNVPFNISNIEVYAKIIKLIIK